MRPTSIDFQIQDPDELGRVYVHATDGWSGLVSPEHSAEQLIAAHRAEVMGTPSKADAQDKPERQSRP